MKNRGCLGFPAPLFRSSNADGWYTPWGLLAVLRNGFANSDRLFLPGRVVKGDRNRYSSATRPAARQGTGTIPSGVVSHSPTLLFHGPDANSQTNETTLEYRRKTA
ncbi:hypothetical protein GQ607_002340 [Colletotrichum asianum]|uniref:Uncharacterized protein n=1 Tax=Colletotrichum asianum TaxID=702518 RepID=A0A8H3ZWR4_9PEZI|nr:hypothetical protein GQ607_002340 [Colletotrichum asianum]